MRHITLITTGGTIEKTYDEMTGELTNRRSIVGRMLEQLRLEDTTIKVRELMHKDSLHMTDDDRRAVVREVRKALAERSGRGRRRREQPGGVVILHGTDTLTRTGERILADVKDLSAPVVLTGAMRPFEMTRSDALQNLTEAIFAAGMLEPGVYCVAHGRALRLPGVRKDRRRGTFVK
jgi:L-asparaginase